jgi:hypothetical protein
MASKHLEHRGDQNIANRIRWNKESLGAGLGFPADMPTLPDRATPELKLDARTQIMASMSPIVRQMRLFQSPKEVLKGMMSLLYHLKAPPSDDFLLREGDLIDGGGDDNGDDDHTNRRYSALLKFFFEECEGLQTVLAPVLAGFDIDFARAEKRRKVREQQEQEFEGKKPRLIWCKRQKLQENREISR